MKLNQRIKRFIAALLVMAITLSSIPITPVYAAEKNEDIAGGIFATIQDGVEERVEAMLDAESADSAGNWFIAISYDQLSWNYFHNKVQKDIIERYTNVEKELYFNKRYINGEIVNKPGRADLYMKGQTKENKYTYLWEIKPNSYSVEPKRSIALEQLNSYVLTDKNKYRIGSNMIKGGEITEVITVPHMGYKEEVEYKIKYTVQSDGLIFYSFTRHLKKSSLAPDSVPVRKKSEADSKATAIQDFFENLTGTPLPQPEFSLDPKLIVGLFTIASALYVSSAKINSNPDTNNSLSAAVMESCDLFMMEMISLGITSDGEVNVNNIDVEALNAAIDDFMLAMEVYIGEDFVGTIIEALSEDDTKAIEELIKLIQGKNKAYDEAGEAQPPRDPLVIDLGATGINLHSLDNGVYFDLDNNGFAEKTAWIDVEDGFLALDRNENGKIDNGGELFGDQVILKDGTKATSGFEALSELDENQNKMIDQEDPIFEELNVWIDANHNGISESGELKILSELGIISISLEHEERSVVDEETGTRIAETAYVTMNQIGNLVEVEISEFWFPINSSDTTHGGTSTAGNVPDLAQAIADDETGELYKLVYQFGESEDIAEKRYYVTQILYFLTGASDIEINSRGGNIDARNLKVIEKFMGREFVGVDGSSPNTNAAAILNDIYNDIEEQYYNILNLYTAFGVYWKSAYEYEDENGNKALELAYLQYFIDTKISNGENADVLIYDLGLYLRSFDQINSTDYYQEYSKYYSSVSSHYADIIKMTESSSTYIGTDGNDSYGGTSKNDYIFGEAGNDTLSGGVGNDYISGGDGDDVLNGATGNDILSGNAGDDTYIFARSYGNDTIIDSEGSNTIRFTDISFKDILVNGTGENDVTIKIKGSNDTLVIKDFCRGEEFADFMLEFKDKTVYCNDADSPFKHIYGSDTDDTLKAVVDDSIIHAFGGDDTVTGSKGSDIIYGNEGNDTIKAGEGNDTAYGGDGNDFIYGETSDDIIFGEDGQDILDGGSGNDYMFGGAGDDTYIFGNGYGTDIIEDAEGISAIKLNEDLSVDDIYVFETNNEAVIHIKDTKDVLIISGYGDHSDAFILSAGEKEINIKDIISSTIPENIEEAKYIVGTDDSDALFADNEKNIITSGNQYDYIVGGNDKDIIFGDDDTDRILAKIGNDIIYGSEGSDQLFGEDDHDLIVGGAGNDYISCGNGNDIVIPGEGNDLIGGSSGNDTYYFNIGNGSDTVMDNQGENTIIFGDAILSSGLKAYRNNWNDLLIAFDDIDNTITIKDYCIDESARSFKFIFADGTVFEATDADSLLRTINDNIGTEFIPSIYQDGIIIISTDGDDELTGSNKDDILVGGNGNNRITGKAGDDILDGGKGSDYLNGGAGSDTYIYKKGYGTDAISDSEGVNYIEITEYSVSDVRAYRTNWNDITLVLDGSGEQGLTDSEADKITIEGFYISEASRNFYLSFNGSRVHATSSSSPLRIIYGTSDSEYMQGFDNGRFTIYGNDGVDTLNGGASDDYLYGGLGDDRLLGYAGNDTLNGEEGNDYLEGGEGDDTYIFNLGSGIDSINDKQGTNKICFGESLDKDKLTAYKTENNLTITFEDVKDQLVIQDYFVAESNRVFDVEFADGSNYAYDSLNNPVNQIYATDSDDWLDAWSNDGIYLNGAAGSDNLTGGSGNDILSGGTGIDTLTGGAGDDIYIFNAGDGLDTITDIEGVNKVIFRHMNSTDVVITYEMVDNTVHLGIFLPDSEEGIVITNYSVDNFIMEFANGITGNVLIEDSAATFVQTEE